MKKTVLLLAPLVVALPVAMDIYVPAVPHIAAFFHVSAGEMQLTLTLFMLTAGIMQLWVGPLSDQYGRRKIALASIVTFALGSGLCATAQSVPMLIFYRVIQAMGACGMLVVGFAIVRDVFEGEQSAQVYSFLNGMLAFSPMFAPFVGSYLDVHFNWPATFQGLLPLAAIAGLVMFVYFPETLPKSKRRPIRVTTLIDYKAIAVNPVFAIYTIAGAVGLSYLYLFFSISPYIIIRLLHIPELHYGFYFCFMGISFFVGSFLSGYIVAKIGIYKTVLLGFIITLIGSLAMSIWYFMAGLTIDGFIWPMLLIGIGGTLCMGAGNGGAMEPFPDRAGIAAALGGAFRFIFSAILGSLLITSSVSSTLPLALPGVVFSVLGILYFIIWRRVVDFSRATST